MRDMKQDRPRSEQFDREIYSAINPDMARLTAEIETRRQQGITVQTPEERALLAVETRGTQMRRDAERAALLKDSIATHRPLLEKLTGRGNDDNER
jgi:hypothetical protein